MSFGDPIEVQEGRGSITIGIPGALRDTSLPGLAPSTEQTLGALQQRVLDLEVSALRLTQEREVLIARVEKLEATIHHILTGEGAKPV